MTRAQIRREPFLLTSAPGACLAGLERSPRKQVDDVSSGSEVYCPGLVLSAYAPRLGGAEARDPVYRIG
jgi:hypothetical protein